MFTQSMPALAQGLSGAIPDGAVRQLMQALGNCQQPLTHRGAVNVQPPGLSTRGGLAKNGTWRPSDYKNLLPTAGSGGYVDVPGGGGGSGGGSVNNSRNYDGNQFYFPTDLRFEYTDYYGGDTLNVTGPSNFDYSTHNTVNAGDIYTNSLRVNYINNTYVGTPGRDGRDGVGGGGVGGGGVGFFPGPGGGFGPQLPAALDVKTFMKSVGVTATAKVEGFTGGKLDDDFDVELESGVVTKPVDVTGTLDAPIIKSAQLDNIEAEGKATIPTVTGGTVSGITASGTVAYDTYPTGTLADLSGSVDVPTVASASMEAASSEVSISYDAYPTATVTAGAAATVKVPVVDSATWTGSITGIAVSSDIGSLSGTVSFPVVSKAVWAGSISGIAASGGIGSLSGTVSVPVVSKAAWAGSISGIAATGTIGTLRGTVSVPVVNAATWNGAITGIAASGTLGTLAGTIKVPVVTGGFLDANCKFVPTVADQVFTVAFTGVPGVKVTSQGTVAGTVTLTKADEARDVTLAGAPGVNVTSQGTVAGTVTLTSAPEDRNITLAGTPTATVTSQGTVAGKVELASKEQTHTVTSPLPTVTLNKEVRTAKGPVAIPAAKITLTPGNGNHTFTLAGGKVTNAKSPGSAGLSISVTGGTVTPTTGTQDVAVKVSVGNANVSLTRGSEPTPFAANGEISVTETTGAKIVGSKKIVMTPGDLKNKIDVKTAPKSDFIVYLRPRA